MVLNCMFYVVSVEADLVECIIKKKKKKKSVVSVVGGGGKAHMVV
jgi:hypothetical protein